MADNQNYYYMRIKENFFDDPKIKIIESQTDGYLFINILFKMYLKSLEYSGKLVVTSAIPYDVSMLATVTGHQIGTVERAIKIFESLGLIEILSSGVIYMLDIQNYIGKSSTEADRKRSYRDRIETEKKMLGQMSGQISDKSTPELELELELEPELELELDKKDRIDYQQIIGMYNDTCVSFPNATKLSDSRKKMIKARLKDYSIDEIKQCFEMVERNQFLKGANDRGWKANFDWIMKDANMAKVLDGNYEKNKSSEIDDREGYQDGDSLMEKLKAQGIV